MAFFGRLTPPIAAFGRLVLCFVLLPFLPLAMFLLVPEGDLSIEPVGIAAFTIAVAVAFSAAVALLARRSPFVIVLYGAATGALAFVVLAVALAVALEINCGATGCTRTADALAS